MVQTHLQYSVPPKETPYQWVNLPADGSPKSNYTSKSHEWEIEDLRSSNVRYGLDETGFDTVAFDTQTEYETFNDTARIEKEYYPEIEALLKEQLGVHRVVIFDHTIRRTAPPGDNAIDSPDRRQPVSRVHVDQTWQASVARVHRHTGEDAEELLKGRVRLINVWRPLRGPVKDFPLAVADFNSVDINNDLISSELRYPDRTGYTYMVKHNRNHRWYFLQDQQPNEALLLKCYDSLSIATPDGVKPGIAALTPHTAFENEAATKAGYAGPRRESIEVRTLVFG